ncbi:DUF1800 family protein, partial [Puniceicoccaceae bacterium]|nr:DUF1800 family protein [Puniceicoccaceae bacterium]
MTHIHSVTRFLFGVLFGVTLIGPQVINAESVQFSPFEDVYIQSSTVSRYGNQLRCQNGVRTTYIKFVVTDIPVDGTITGVSLGLQENGDTGNGTLRFFRGSNTTWSEDSITASNAPTTQDQVGIHSGSIGSAEMIDVNLDSLVSGNGSYTIIVEMDSGGNDVAFGSRESNRSPTLTVTYEPSQSSQPAQPLGFEVTFNDSDVGPQPSTIWNSKWDGNNPSQRQLWTVGASNGVSGSRGYSLDVTTASRNYHTVYHTAVTGDADRTLNLSADFRFSTTGAPINESASGGVNGINDSFIGLLLTTEPTWWQVNNDNGNFSFTVCRRHDDYWGFYFNGLPIGWLPNSAIGLATGTTPSSSDWFTLNAELVPNSNATYTVTCTASYEETTLFTSDAIVLPSAYAVTAPIYGGLTSGYNLDPNNSGAATGQDAVLQFPVGSIAKVASLDVDNFTFLGEGDTILPPQADLLDPHGLTINPTAQDLDANGFPDIWEAFYQASGLDPLADSDGDGTNNITEAGFGTDPFDPNVSPRLSIRKGEGNSVVLSWTRLEGRPCSALSFNELGTQALPINAGTPVANGSFWELTIPISQDAEFFQISSSENDLDADGVPDWIEPLLGFSSDPGDSESVALVKSYDTDGDNIYDTTLSGDLAAFNEIYRRSTPSEQLTQAQAARLLLQGTFGPASVSEVNAVASIGAEAWLDQQMALPESYTRPYIDTIKADFNNGQTDPALAGYQINGGGGTPFVGGGNYTTAWMRVALQSEDQLRQRVAFALSQILVASRSSAGLANQPRAT